MKEGIITFTIGCILNSLHLLFGRSCKHHAKCLPVKEGEKKKVLFHFAFFLNDQKLLFQGLAKKEIFTASL